ncbi:MAG: cell division protein ZapE [Roseiarcus sp.]|jgi:cell division protein ZapE
MSLSIQQRYREFVAAGRLEPDPAQIALIDRLDALAARLDGYSPVRAPNAFERLIGVRQAEAPRGLYIFGPVGRGKTLLMDLFFDAAPVKAKRRVHFHAFMADVHARLHRWRARRKGGETAGDDPIAPVAAALAAQAWLLCFDEFSVGDIADAMILGRLFAQLSAAGVVVVATSNVAPDDLYKDGLNRTLFLPFIALMHERLEIFALDARADFRLEKLRRAPVFHSPADAAARIALDEAFSRLTGHEHGGPVQIDLLGRTLDVPEAWDGVARFSFDDLCRRPLGAPDFLAIAQRFHTLLIDGIRVIRGDQRNEARRFINLIDTLYDQRVKLIASAEAEPGALFLGKDGPEAFEFERTASRLIEMRSTDYLARGHGAAGSGSSGDMGGLVET